MNISVLIVTIFIFLNNLGYAIYELKNQNKLAGICVIILSIIMIVFVNYSTFIFR